MLTQLNLHCAERSADPLFPIIFFKTATLAICNNHTTKTAENHLIFSRYRAHEGTRTPTSYDIRS